MSTLCSACGYSKQAYYKSLHKEDEYEREQYIISLVKDIRIDMPMLGGVKLWVILNENGVKVGRDELYKWLRDYDLLVQYKRNYVVTTDSSKWLRQFKNLVKGKIVDAPNQVWVCDITYVKTASGFVFLSLITDAYSRFILGAYVHDSLDTEGPLKALYQAYLQVSEKDLKGIIHHSDRGCQYCSSMYVATLRGKQMKISTTQDGSPYDNAMAERVNGILKKEWLDTYTLTDIQQARQTVERIVKLYNTKRPHSSLNMNTPSTAFVDYTGKYAHEIY